MRLCLVIGKDAEKRLVMRDVVESLGFVALEAADHNSAYLSAHGLLPDVILVGKNAGDHYDSDFIDKISVFKSGKKPCVLVVEKPDMENLAQEFVQQDLLAGPVRQAMGL